MPRPRKFVQKSRAWWARWGPKFGRRNIVRSQYSQSKMLWQVACWAALLKALQAVLGCWQRGKGVRGRWLDKNDDIY